MTSHPEHQPAARQPGYVRSDVWHSGTVGLAWPTLFAQDQANREPAQTIREHALANHETARALMMAMRAQCDPHTWAPQSDELHHWYNDAQDVADVALLAANVATGTKSLDTLSERHASPCLPMALPVMTPPTTARTGASGYRRPTRPDRAWEDWRVERRHRRG